MFESDASALETYASFACSAKNNLGGRLGKETDGKEAR